MRRFSITLLFIVVNFVPVQSEQYDGHAASAAHGEVDTNEQYPLAPVDNFGGEFDDSPVAHDDISGDVLIDDLSVEPITEPVIEPVPAPPAPADLPRIAVYVAGNLPEDEKNALSTRMLASLVNSGRYRGIERGGAFLAEIDREQEHQRSGAVDDAQIMALGRQFGVRYICIAAITPAFGTFQVSARIVDVETAEVIFIGESYSLLESADDFTQVSDKVVRIMFGESEPDPPPVVYLPAPMTQQHSRFRLVIRLSTGALAVGGLVGGIVFDNMVKEEYDRYRDFSTDPENPRGTDAENYDKVQTMRRNIDSNIMMRNVLYGVAAIGLTGFAVTLFF